MKHSKATDLFKHGNKKYKIVAPPTQVPIQDKHGGEYEAKVTIYFSDNNKTPKAKSFSSDDDVQFGTTPDEARTKGLEFGKRLIIGDRI